MSRTETRYYIIGGVCIRITGCLFRENEVLASYRADAPDGLLLDYQVSTEASLHALAENATEAAPHEKTAVIDGKQIRLLLRDGTNEPIISESFENGIHTVKVAESALPIWDSNSFLKLLRLPEQLFAREEFFLHASMIEYHGKAILFTGQKQIGKSTQASLWNECQKAEIINGDRALLRKKDGIWYACGSPYCGTSKICRNKSFPLLAIVLLSQAKQNSVRRATAHETVTAFLDGCSFDPSDAAQTGTVMDTAFDIFGQIKVFRLACLPDKGAVDCLIAALNE